MYRTILVIAMMAVVLVATANSSFAESTATKHAKVSNPYGVSDCTVAQLFDPLKYCGEKIPVNQQIGYCWGCTIKDALQLQKQLGIRLIIP